MSSSSAGQSVVRTPPAERSPSLRSRPTPRRAALAAALGLTLVSGLLAAPVQAAPPPASSAPAPAATAAAAALSSITLTGHGFGHGRGMGQYGAYGYAVAYAYPASKILARFYGGTRLVTSPAAAASQKITVRLTAWDGVNVRITSPGAAFRAGGVLFAAGQVAVLQYSQTTDAVTVSGTSSCTSTQLSARARLARGAGAVITSTVSGPGSDVGKMLNVCAGSVPKAYRGSLTYRSVDASNTGRRLINTVGVDDYLRGVVPREMPASWGDASNGRGFQALQAQAVVARSYALASPPHRAYAKVCDTAVCQVYGGAGSAGRLIEDNRATRAVSATTGRVLVNSSGAIAKTEFSASTGGFSAGGVFPAVSDAGDARAPGNIYHSWRTTVSAAPLQAEYARQFGSGAGLTKLQITQRDSGNRRVVSVRLFGNRGYSTPISGDDIASLLGLYSNWFTVA